MRYCGPATQTRVTTKGDQMATNLKVCACDDMPGLHHPELDLCMGFGGTSPNEPVTFTEQELKDQETCEHDMFGGVCAACGFVDEKQYLQAEEDNKVG